MKLPTTNSLTNGFPLVIATQTQQPTARLLLRNTQGQVVQQWLVKQNKCTLGSAASCSLRCQLSGLAPYHALLVIGARQIFIRALAPKLTRDGRPFNELLLTDEDSHFELAGHRFELTRNNEELRTAARPENSTSERIKFTLARPFELRNRPQSKQLPYANESVPSAEPLGESMPGTDSKWVAQLIQAAMQPLECQLHNLIAPLNELQNESRIQRRLRKKRALRKRNSPERETHIAEDGSRQSVSQLFAQQVDEIVGKHTASIHTISPQFSQQVDEIVGKHTASIHTLSPQFAQQVDEIVGKHAASIQTISPQFAQQVDEIVGKHAASIQTISPQFEQQVDELVGKHAVSMDLLTERILDVNQQLSSIERMVAEERLQSHDQAAALPCDNPQLALQSAAIEQLQQGILTVSSTLEQLQLQHTEACEDDQHWKTNLQSQLEGLTQLIDGLSTSVAEVHHVALRVATQPATIQTEEFQPEAIDQPWPTVDESAYEACAVEENAYEESEFEENAYAETSVAEPFPLETSSDSLVQDEFHFADEALDVESAAQHETIANEILANETGNEFEAADEFDEFSQLQAPLSSSFVDELIDGREPESIESPRMPGARTDDQHVARHSTEEAPLVSAQDERLSSQQLPEIEIFQSKLAKSEVDANEVDANEVDANEVDANEVDANEVDANEVVANEVVANEVVANEVVANEVVAVQPSTAEVAEPRSSSLPSWWMDDESEEDSGNLSADLQVVDQPSDYAPDSEPIAPDSQQISSPATMNDRNDEEPSEEFFGLAQLDLEDHLREAEPLPVDVAHNLQLDISEEAPPEPDADEELIGFGESFAAHPNSTPAKTLAPEPASDFHPMPVAEAPIAEEEDEVADENVAMEESSIPLSGSTFAAAEEEEDDSVEEYMRKLLARMRGVPEDEVELPNSAAGAPALKSGPSAAPADRADAAVHPRAHIERPMPSQDPDSGGPATAGYNPATQAISAEVTEPFDPEKYMPRALAPERSKSLAAMRELANSSARTAIHKSTRQRHVSSILLKAVIAIVGLVVGMVLVAINGLNMNIGLFATVASFLVAAVWGYDAISSIRPMLQNGLVLKPQASPQAPRAPRDEEVD